MKNRDGFISGAGSFLGKTTTKVMITKMAALTYLERYLENRGDTKDVYDSTSVKNAISKFLNGTMVKIF